MDLIQGSFESCDDGRSEVLTRVSGCGKEKNEVQKGVCSVNLVTSWSRPWTEISDGTFLSFFCIYSHHHKGGGHTRGKVPEVKEKSPSGQGTREC
jgi:hypothetical protein